MSDKDVEAGKFDKPGMMTMGPMPTRQPDDSESQHPPIPISDADHTQDKTVGSENHKAMAMAPDQGGAQPAMRPHQMASNDSSSTDRAVDGMDPRRPWPPYTKLRAREPTAFNKGKPVRIIRLTLDGDMERYVWFMNKKPLSESDMIRIKKGEVTRFVMINRTMMHHPMHLHGHFFRVINGQGDYAPLKHTVDVTPMSTTVIEFDANEVGDWFFHCHLLYHLESGMARVVHYESFEITPELARIRKNLYHDSWYSWTQADVLGNMTEGFITLSNTRNIVSATWEVGWQNVRSTEWEGLLSYDRYINRFFSVFAGVDALGAGDHLEDTRGVLGFHYLLPFNLETSIWIDTDGGVRAILARSFQLTSRLGLFGEVQYDTHDRWEKRVRLAYLVHKSISIVGQWHSDYGISGGLQIRF